MAKSKLTPPREVHEQKSEYIAPLDPFVETPRLRVSDINRLNELIKRNNAMAIVEKEIGLAEHKIYSCPVCGKCFGESGLAEYKFCYRCGQRLDTTLIAF